MSDKQDEARKRLLVLAGNMSDTACAIYEIAAMLEPTPPTVDDTGMTFRWMGYEERDGDR